MRIRSIVSLVLLTCVMTLPLYSQRALSVRGVVLDPAGNPVSASKVLLGSNSALTSNEGTFEITGTGSTLQVSAPGFAPTSISVDENTHDVKITLSVSRVEQRIDVTANAEGPSAITRDELALQPAFALDTALRQVPGFSLFRRTPSWSANPTAQGVSLRGLGASGASRALVLVDGETLNDPFGGWIYWGRVTPMTISEASVNEGTASELYGTDAIGGVVNLVRNEERLNSATIDSSIGNLFTSSASAQANIGRDRWSLGVTADAFRTNGYVPTPEDVRGAVDTVASSEHRMASLRVDRKFNAGRIFVGGDLYGESRQNGTVLQENAATIRTLRTGGDWTGAAGQFSLRVFGGTENLRQTFSSISQDRNTESLTRDQSVPASQVGSTFLWSRPFLGRHMIAAGADVRAIEGESFEWAFVGGGLSPTSNVRSGGRQLRSAVFGEDRIRLGQQWLLKVAARLDRWSDSDAFTRTRPLNGGSESITPFADRDETAFSPKIVLSYAPNQTITLHASAGRGFRAPTLNELYRSFRVGNALTLANSELEAERVTSVEGGVRAQVSSRDAVRATYFWNDMTRAVANITLSVTPSLITRQRQNLGRTRSTGVELSWESRLSDRLGFDLAYQFVNPVVADFPSNRELEGLWIPQVARNNVSAAVRYAAPGSYAFSVQARWQGKQYDDDRNLFPLGSYVIVDAFASKNLATGLELYIAAENIGNRRIEVGRTPVLSIGPPIVARVGMRWTIGRR